MRPKQAVQKVKELRQNGYRIFVNHHRLTRPDNTVIPQGGSTIVKILKGEEILSKGECRCSLNDNFNKKIGLSIALGRSLQSLEK